MEMNREEKKEKNRPNLRIVEDDNKKIETPEQEIQVERKEIEMLTSIQQTKDFLVYKLGELEQNYLNQKAQIIGGIRQNETEAVNTEKVLKQKYKIIGKIKGYDIKKCVLVIENNKNAT